MTDHEHGFGCCVLPARKARCRLLDGRLNRCPNEALSDDGLALCAAHYAAAVRDYCRLTGGKLALHYATQAGAT